jgi:hypothetical protein
MGRKGGKNWGLLSRWEEPGEWELGQAWEHWEALEGRGDCGSSPAAPTWEGVSLWDLHRREQEGRLKSHGGGRGKGTPGRKGC